jgi:hypothetical protein
MSWSVRIFAAVLLLSLLWLLFYPPHHQVAPSATAAHPAAIVTEANASAPASATARVTVYQSSGQHGEAHFTDRIGQGRPRIVDHANGTTFSSTYGGKPPETASVTYDAITDPVRALREENVEKQAQIKAHQDRQMDAAMGQ